MPYCKVCSNRYFVDAEALRQHVRGSRQQHFYCGTCDRIFNNAAGLQMHLKTSSAHSYCQLCSRAFSDEHALAQHMHNSPRHDTCPCCDGGDMGSVSSKGRKKRRIPRGFAGYLSTSPASSAYDSNGSAGSLSPQSSLSPMLPETDCPTHPQHLQLAKRAVWRSRVDSPYTSLTALVLPTDISSPTIPHFLLRGQNIVIPGDISSPATSPRMTSAFGADGDVGMGMGAYGDSTKHLSIALTPPDSQLTVRPSKSLESIPSIEKPATPKTEYEGGMSPDMRFEELDGLTEGVGASPLAAQFLDQLRRYSTPLLEAEMGIPSDIDADDDFRTHVFMEDEPRSQRDDDVRPEQDGDLTLSGHVSPHERERAVDEGADVNTNTHGVSSDIMSTTTRDKDAHTPPSPKSPTLDALEEATFSPLPRAISFFSRFAPPEPEATSDTQGRPLPSFLDLRSTGSNCSSPSSSPNTATVRTPSHRFQFTLSLPPIPEGEPAGAVLEPGPKESADADTEGYAYQYQYTDDPESYDEDYYYSDDDTESSLSTGYGLPKRSQRRPLSGADPNANVDEDEDDELADAHSVRSLDGEWDGSVDGTEGGARSPVLELSLPEAPAHAEDEQMEEGDSTDGSCPSPSPLHLLDLTRLAREICDDTEYDDDRPLREPESDVDNAHVEVLPEELVRPSAVPFSPGPSTPAEGPSRSPSSRSPSSRSPSRVGDESSLASSGVVISDGVLKSYTEDNHGGNVSLPVTAAEEAFEEEDDDSDDDALVGIAVTCDEEPSAVPTSSGGPFRITVIAPVNTNSTSTTDEFYTPLNGDTPEVTDPDAALAHLEAAGRILTARMRPETAASIVRTPPALERLDCASAPMLKPGFSAGPSTSPSISPGTFLASLAYGSREGSQEELALSGLRNVEVNEGLESELDRLEREVQDELEQLSRVVASCEERLGCKVVEGHLAGHNNDPDGPSFDLPQSGPSSSTQVNGMSREHRQPDASSSRSTSPHRTPYPSTSASSLDEVERLCTIDHTDDNVQAQVEVTLSRSGSPLRALSSSPSRQPTPTNAGSSDPSEHTAELPLTAVLGDIPTDVSSPERSPRPRLKGIRPLNLTRPKAVYVRMHEDDLVAEVAGGDASLLSNSLPGRDGDILSDCRKERVRDKESHEDTLPDLDARYTSGAESEESVRRSRSTSPEILARQSLSRPKSATASTAATPSESRAPSPIWDISAPASASLGAGTPCTEVDTDTADKPLYDAFAFTNGPEHGHARMETSVMHCRLCRADPCIETTATFCGHIFCYQCITREVMQTSKCPVCKTPTLLYCLFRLDLSC